MGVFIFETSTENGKKLESLLKSKKLKIISAYSFTDSNSYMIKVSTTLRMYMKILRFSSPQFVITGTEETIPELQMKIKKR